ncbi:Cytidine deaminase [Kytococcus aerolatus]|uniref:Cytidine deaminase n=1 Tax=Kytococcus aerolatus TaxID=592308 RepID=A0A212TF92_9MICO|nr:cytidine deaminase [Kytococcus aerolatus]SNC64682.1 Cytidine deaminase [Kytococcus aerolatus]
MTFPNARPLTEEDVQLVELATRTIDAQTDTTTVDQDGIHTVGAAVRTDDGRLHAGVNLSHFTGGPCAELVALGSARAAGGRVVTTIVAVGNHGRGVLAPCGRDRQVLADYHPGCRVIVPGEAGTTGEHLRSVPIGDLLPGAYRASFAVEADAPQA